MIPEQNQLPGLMALEVNPHKPMEIQEIVKPQEITEAQVIRKLHERMEIKEVRNREEIQVQEIFHQRGNSQRSESNSRTADERRLRCSTVW